MTTSSSILGDLPAADFLGNYWQRKPLLVKGALVDFPSPVSADELAGLALEADVESRIVLGSGAEGSWRLRHGPFQSEDFQQFAEKDWTLLVQAIDLWVPDSQLLLDHFDFLPRWRIDDIMASYATVGGSVGPHFDQYDVFLLQVEGQRRWQIGGRCNEQTPLLADTDLQLVADFQVEQEWLLNPGDMLYLPPQISHWGVAESECLTFSVGFRSPTLADMLGDLAIEIAAQGNNQHYTDPPLTPKMAGESIDAAFVQQAKQLLLGLLDDDALIEDWLARFMTSSKYPGLEDITEEQRTATVGKRRYRNGELLG